MFIGRHHENEILNGFYEGDNLEIAVVTGSIGVGKSTLLKRFARENDGIYFEAYETTLRHMHSKLGEVLDIKESVDGERFCKEILRRASLKKQLIIIDQYHNIVKADPEFDKVLHDNVTGKFLKYPIKIIFCTDAFMSADKYLTGKKALWRDDITEKLDVQAFGFYDSLAFMGDANPEEAAFLYGITGGIAYNLERVAAMLGVNGFEDLGLKKAENGPNRTKEIAMRLFLDKAYSVGLNPQRVMSTELRELAYYNYMLTCLAKGINRVNAISAEVDKPKDVVVPYLNSLINIGVCTKDTAITELNNRKKTRYSIVNTSTLFWYRFLVPSYGRYCDGDLEGLWAEVESGLDDYMKQVFINICKEYLLQQSKKEELPFTIEEMGNWWVNDDEAGTTDGFDLVSLGKCEGKSATIYAQCYYTKEPIEVAQLKSLIEKTKQLHRNGDAFYLVFSKAGFNENAITISSAIKNIMLITLDEMR